MGHERVGALPRSKEWRRVVDEIGASSFNRDVAPSIASATLQNVRRRLDAIQDDTGFRAAFSYILALSTSRLAGVSADVGYPRIDLGTNPSVLTLAHQMSSWVDEHATSREYAELAKRAAADAMAYWTKRRQEQGELFASGATAAQVWGDAGDGAAFSDICRVFFGKFVERYLRYFLDREASSVLPTVEAREQFGDNLQRHVDLLATHAFESTKIAQSFAAGWFNKNARASRPDEQTIASFLSYALSKLRQEIQREASEQ